MPRRFQFGLRTLFWLTTLAAVACVVGPWAVQEYREYRWNVERKRLIRLIQETIEPVSTTLGDDDFVGPGALSQEPDTEAAVGDEPRR